MAADGTPLLCASAFAAAVDGAAITTVVANDLVEEELASRRDSVAANRGCGGALERREEADVARGWSSAVVERGLALRRRGGSASFCRPRGGLVGTAAATATKERRGRREEAGASCALGVGAEAEEPVVDPGVAFFCLAVL